MEEDRVISLKEAIEAIRHVEVNFSVQSEINFAKHIREVQEIIDNIIHAQEKALMQLLPVTSKPLGLCKDCKFFEYDSMAKVDGIPLIVAHEICNKWGDGCKTQEDGYCFLFERREEGEEE